MFPGIGPKYARNIMMDVYHDDFRESIALDVRIQAISKALGLSFPSYAAQEQFYLDVAHEAGLNGWELDRLLFNFRQVVMQRLGLSEPAANTCAAHDPSACHRTTAVRRRTTSDGSETPPDNHSKQDRQ
jgi:hypothetical protein